MPMEDVAVGDDAAEIFEGEMRDQGWTRMYALLLGEEIILVGAGKTVPADESPELARYTAAEVGLLASLKLKPAELKGMHAAKKELGGVFLAEAPEPTERPNLPPPKACEGCGERFWRTTPTGFACGWCVGDRAPVTGDRKALLDVARASQYPRMMLSPAAEVRPAMVSWERFAAFAKPGAVTGAIDWLARRKKGGS